MVHKELVCKEVCKEVMSVTELDFVGSVVAAAVLSAFGGSHLSAESQQ